MVIVQIWTILIFSTVALSDLVENNKVPVILWNIKGSALQVQPVAAFDEDSAENAMHSVHDKLTDRTYSIIAYVNDELSMEDLGGTASCNHDTCGQSETVKTLKPILEKEPHMLYPSVRDPVKHLEKSDCGVETIYASKENEDSLQKSISSALEKSCVVIVYLTGTKSPTREVFVPSAKMSKNNIVGMFTAKRSSWIPDESKTRQGRSLMEAAASDNHFFNSSCIIMYIFNATVTVGSTGNDTRELPFPPEVKTTCDNSSAIQLTFKDVKGGVNVALDMVFKVKNGAWLADKCTATLTGGDISAGERKLLCGNVEAPLKYSFSCGDLVLKAHNSTPPLVFSLNRFQVQPFGVEGGKFASSFDCITFFTIPIWMGIFVTLLFIIILNTGIYALFSIKTMDRFDDPKGKTISVQL